MKPEEKSVLQKNTRRSDIELYRIVCMLLIVMHHYVVNSGLMDAGGPIQTNGMAKRTLFLLLLGAWGKTAINGFIMITGYFMCKKNITLIKFLKLLFETMFYRIVINLIFCISGYTAFTAETLKTILFPVRDVSFSFPQVYLVFFLCIPFMNILLRRLTEEKHVALLLLVGFTYQRKDELSLVVLRGIPARRVFRDVSEKDLCEQKVLGDRYGWDLRDLRRNRSFRGQKRNGLLYPRFGFQ